MDTKLNEKENYAIYIENVTVLFNMASEKVDNLK